MNASGRRCRQAKQKFNHLTPRQRPNYKMRDKASSERHLRRVMEKEQRIRQGSRKKKG